MGHLHLRALQRAIGLAVPAVLATAAVGAATELHAS
jgi:hypothetical protein